MSLDKRFKKPVGKKKLSFAVDGEVADEFELFLKYAHEDGCDWLTPDVVAETFFRESLNRDRDFRSWLAKSKNNKPGSSTPSSGSG